MFSVVLPVQQKVMVGREGMPCPSLSVAVWLVAGKEVGGGPREPWDIGRFATTVAFFNQGALQRSLQVRWAAGWACGSGGRLTQVAVQPGHAPVVPWSSHGGHAVSKGRCCVCDRLICAARFACPVASCNGAWL
jgi:hypothetical protein